MKSLSNAETLISTIGQIRPELDIYYVGGSTYTADMQASAQHVKYAHGSGMPVFVMMYTVVAGQRLTIGNVSGVCSRRLTTTRSCI